MSTLCLLVLALLLPELVLASWYGPEPFRRERIEGRDFEYETESFLNRFSFNPVPALQPERLSPRDGVFGTGGSTRSNELYVRQQVQMSVPTDNAAYLGYRFFRGEDFDGRYDEQLLGVGARQEQWQLVFWGDVEGDKGETDIQLELQRFGTRENYWRLILAAPDAIYNKKTASGDEYQQSPFTLYVSGQLALSDASSVYGFFNWNAPTRFVSQALHARVDDRQVSAGVGQQWVQSHWLTGIEIEGLYGNRQRDAMNDNDPIEQSVRRHFYQLTLERRSRAPWQQQAWYGIRYLNIDEHDRRPFSAAEWLHQQRREMYAFAGHQWALSNDITFAPTLIAGHANIVERFPLQTHESHDDSVIIGKLLPAFVFSLRRDHSATVTISPTLYLHKKEFGGGNVQLRLPLTMQ